MLTHRDLTDAEWATLDPLIPETPLRHNRRGRPPRGRREVLEGILYVLDTGVSWAGLPDRYPPYKTCHRRFQQWLRSGILRQILEGLPEHLKIREDAESTSAY